MTKSVLHFIFLLKMRHFKVSPPKKQIKEFQKTLLVEKKKSQQNKEIQNLTCLFTFAIS